MTLNDHVSDQLNYIIHTMLNSQRAKIITEAGRLPFLMFEQEYSRHIDSYKKHLRSLELKAIAMEYGEAVDIGLTPYDHGDY